VLHGLPKPVCFGLVVQYLPRQVGMKLLQGMLGLVGGDFSARHVDIYNL
jgi:hypothetical protein